MVKGSIHRNNVPGNGRQTTAVVNYDEEVQSGEETVFRIAQRQFVDDPHIML
jgi:hypothetical protein